MGRDSGRLLPFCLVSLGLHLAAFAFLAWSSGGRATPPPAKVIEVRLEDLVRQEVAERVLQSDSRPKPVAQPRQPAKRGKGSVRVPTSRQRPERQPSAPPAVGAPAQADPSHASTVDPAPVTQSTRHEPHVDAPAERRIHKVEAPTVAGDAAGAEVAEARYTALIRALIERRKEYPPQARKAGQTGTTLVGFVLAKNGELLEAKVAGSCGRSLLDRAAVRAVEGVGRFPPFPERAWGDSRVFQVPISFRIE